MTDLVLPMVLRLNLGRAARAIVQEIDHGE